MVMEMAMRKMRTKRPSMNLKILNGKMPKIPENVHRRGVYPHRRVIPMTSWYNW